MSAMRPPTPPFLSAGFRPFFLAAATWSALSLAAWLPLLTGQIDLPSRFDPISLHIHEMLFGFVMAAVAGFVLTAIPNWTNRPPLAGMPLLALALLWLLGRLACLASALLPGWLAPLLDVGFPVALAAVATRELVFVGNARNYPLLVPIILLAIGNLLSHLQTLDVAVPIGLGWRLSMAAILTLIAVIGGRIVPAFTSNWLGARSLPTVPPPLAWLEHAARIVLIVALLAWVFLPDFRPVGILLLLAAALHLVRIARWRGQATAPEPLLLVLHIGQLWLGIGLVLLGLSMVWDAVPAAAAIHALTAGAMGTMALAVMTRATLGHTGHVLHADTTTDIIYALVNAAAVLRVAAAFTVGAQMNLLTAAAAAWITAFALFVAHYGPLLVAPRRR
jgi:uncharacterized protein involved in response to NO